MTSPLTRAERLDRLPNRVVFCAHLTNQAVDRLPTAAHTA